MNIHVADAVGQSVSASESKASAAERREAARGKGGAANRELNRVCLKYSGDRLFAEAIKRNPDAVLRFGRSYRKLLACILAFETKAQLADDQMATFDAELKQFKQDERRRRSKNSPTSKRRVLAFRSQAPLQQHRPPQQRRRRVGGLVTRALSRARVPQPDRLAGAADLKTPASTKQR